MTQLFRVGEIVNTQGIKGEVRVLTVTDFPEERFQPGSQLVVGQSAATAATPVTVESARPHKQFILLKFVGIDSINDAEPLKKQTLFVSDAEQGDLAEGEFYYRQIIGLTVLEEETGEELGTVREILSPGANDVWVVAKPGTPDLLIPYIPQVVHRVDLAAGKVYVELMEGMR